MVFSISAFDVYGEKVYALSHLKGTRSLKYTDEVSVNDKTAIIFYINISGYKIYKNSNQNSGKNIFNRSDKSF